MLASEIRIRSGITTTHRPGFTPHPIVFHRFYRDQCIYLLEVFFAHPPTPLGLGFIATPGLCRLGMGVS